MKVKCKSNKGKSLGIEYLAKTSWFNENDEFQLIPEKEYVVYGVFCSFQEICYLLCDEDYSPSDFPKWFPVSLFEITDNKISKYCRFYCDEEKYLSGSFVFKEFEEDLSYYEKLFDGDKEAVSIFLKYKKAMDAEANIAQEVDAIINILSKRILKTDRDNGWYEGSQNEILNLLLRLQSDFSKNFPIAENDEYLNLLKTVESLGVDTGDLYELLLRISDYIKSLKSVDTQ